MFHLFYLLPNRPTSKTLICQSITYDAIGNPLTYRDGMTMTWQAGRQLESITQNGKTYNFT